MEKLKEFYHKYILGQRRCPACNNWCENVGIDGLRLWQDEYYCSKCKGYFYK